MDDFDGNGAAEIAEGDIVRITKGARRSGKLWMVLMVVPDDEATEDDYMMMNDLDEFGGVKSFDELGLRSDAFRRELRLVQKRRGLSRKAFRIVNGGERMS